MTRRQTSLGMLIALVGGFAVAKATTVLDLGIGIAAIGYAVVIGGLLLFQVRKQLGPAGPARRS